MDSKCAAPLVSVITPAYNAASFIEEAIGSVIAQTVTDWELVVIDDRSTDDTFAMAQHCVADDPRIRLLKNDMNMGVAKTRNRGLDLCRGQYVALLDSDDYWKPQFLEKMLARAERELSGKLLPEELPPADIPERVSRWMKSFCLPWETFWCYDHRRWCDELDSSFPYFAEGNSCPECRS